MDYYKAKYEAEKELNEKLLLQAQIWAGEAKTHRATVLEVGALLKGVPTWGPIAKTVGEKLERLKELEVDYAEKCQQRVNLDKDMAEMTQELIDAGLRKPAITEQPSDHNA